MSSNSKVLRLKSFAKRLNEAMLAAGFNQSDLARQASLHMANGRSFHRDNVSKYLRGKSAPSPLYLDAMAKALGKAPTDLWPEAKNMERTENDPTFRIEDKGDGMAYLKIDQPVSWKAAIEIARILREDNEAAEAEEK
jgi:transcriptional regulator with XRE-family HTH domain